MKRVYGDFSVFLDFQIEAIVLATMQNKLSRNFVVNPFVNVENGILIGKKLGSHPNLMSTQLTER